MGHLGQFLGQVQSQVGNAGLSPEQAGLHLLCGVSMLTVCCWLLKSHVCIQHLFQRVLGPFCGELHLQHLCNQAGASGNAPLYALNLKEGLLVSVMQTEGFVSTSAVGAWSGDCHASGA